MKAEDVLRPTAPKKRVITIGDYLTDVYVHGRLDGCQDGCPKFVQAGRVEVCGGAANAARSLFESSCETDLFYDMHRGQCVKERFIVDGRIVWRRDHEDLSSMNTPSAQEYAMRRIQEWTPDGVYVSDYAKGFITDDFMRQIVAECNKRGIPCVVDPKRDPKWCLGAVLKCNDVYHAKHNREMTGDYVVTQGPLEPCVSGTIHYDGKILTLPEKLYSQQVVCRNHVGAGDCFGAWLTLGLAHGLELVEAARLAHAAGRSYVQHPHNRPPWPHEIRKELDPVGGKVLALGEETALRQSCTDRIVLTNGVFRILQSGHCEMLQWAKQQGDILVVAVNDDVSAFRSKPGEFCLPLEQRLHLICSQQAVDFVVPFSEDTPIDLIRTLQPNCVAKGPDYAEKDVCGSDVCEVRIAPYGSHRGHVSDIIRAVRGR